MDFLKPEYPSVILSKKRLSFSSGSAFRCHRVLTGAVRIGARFGAKVNEEDVLRQSSEGETNSGAGVSAGLRRLVAK